MTSRRWRVVSGVHGLQLEAFAYLDRGISTLPERHEGVSRERQPSLRGAKRASTSSAPGGSMAQPRCAVETELATDEAESHVVRHNNFFSDRLLALDN